MEPEREWGSERADCEWNGVSGGVKTWGWVAWHGAMGCGAVDG